MKKFLLTFCIALAFVGKAQMVDTLSVHYYENFPYAFTEAGKLKGIEIDIINEYVLWLKQRKNITLVVNYTPYKEFSAFYASVKDGRSTVVGLGSVTRNAFREQEVAFSPPYLQNDAVLISSGRIPTVREKSNDEVARVFSTVHGIAVKGSSHVGYLNQIKSQFLPQLNISTAESQNQVLETILSDNTTIGYVDIVAYWAYLKSHQGKFLKIQKAFTEPREELGFILPLKSKQSILLAEFFEGGFGFTATKTYQQILEKYLGFEVLESVEIK
jgi:putative glutamine transport system substrate-binding protein